MTEVPYERLRVPAPLKRRFEEGMTKRERYSLAKGAMPLADDAALGVLYLLVGDEVKKIADTARASLISRPMERVISGIDRNTHPKIMELLAELRTDTSNRLREVIYRNPNINDRTALILARDADESLCEVIVANHIRLLLTPKVFVELHANERCPDVLLARARTFLQMQDSLPSVPAERPFRQSAAPSPPPASAMDLEAEIDAALTGRQSPSLLSAQSSMLSMFDLDQFDDDFDSSGLGSFRFDFEDEDESFSFDLTTEREERTDDDEGLHTSLANRLKDMAVGHRIKLAYKGNKEVRGLLLRDSNKTVAVAVVRSGRMTEGEITAAAGNRNLGDDVIREIAKTKEYVRKYPVKVALASNSKTPVPIALSMMKSLHKKDLKSLSSNRNVSSVISNTARKIYKKKFQRG